MRRDDATNLYEYRGIIMGYVFDIVIVCVIALFVLIGIRRGLVRAAVRFFGVLIVTFVSAALGEAIATGIYNTFFRDSFIEKINLAIADVSGTEQVYEALDSLPEFLQRGLNAAGINSAKLSSMLSSKSGEAAEIMADAISPVFIGMIKVLVVIVLFMVLMMLVRAISNMVGATFRLPILRSVDSALGGVFGFLMALMTIWIILALLGVFSPMLSTEMQQSINDVMEMSVLADKFISFNPLDSIFK